MVIGLSSKSSPSDIIYYSNTFSVYKQDKYIIIFGGDYKEISRVLTPIDHERHEIISTPEYLLIFFSGKNILSINIRNYECKLIKLDDVKIGRCITKPILLDQDHIVFGTKVKDRIQIVKYNFKTQEREAQSCSWNVHGLNNFNFSGNYIFGVLDNSMIFCCNNEMENIWNRFEAAKIQRGILFYKDKIVYTSQGVLRMVWMNNITSILVPTVRFNSLEHIDNDRLYGTSKNGSTICCVSLKDNNLIWEVTTKSIIDSCLAVFKYKNKEIDCLVARTRDSVTVLNCENGLMLDSIPVNDSTQMKLTDNFIVINQTSGTTIIGEK